MIRAISRLIRQPHCRHHRWRPDRKVAGREFCDLCRAKGKTA